MISSPFTSIRTIFINQDSGAIIAQSDIPFEQLPEWFESNSVVQIRDQEWQILSTDPKTKAEAKVGGKLTLQLKPFSVQMVDPKKLLFSLPTICDPLADLEKDTDKKNQSILELHEDDWRQIEFISKEALPDIRKEMTNIEQIYSRYRTTSGAFHKLHVRNMIKEPLKGRLPSKDTLATLTLPATTSYTGVAYRDSRELLKEGFAFCNPSGLCFYGTYRGNAVAILGVQVNSGKKESIDSEADRLAMFLQANALVLVDWPRMVILEDKVSAIRAYLSQ